MLTKIAPNALEGIFDARPDLTADLGAEDRAFLDAMIPAFLPVTSRLDGTANEGATIDPDTSYPTDLITAPTLVVHARDDGINPFAIAEYAARSIPGARLLTFETGGHMMLGRTRELRTALRTFLDRHAP